METSKTNAINLLNLKEAEKLYNFIVNKAVKYELTTCKDQLSSILEAVEDYRSIVVSMGKDLSDSPSDFSEEDALYIEKLVKGFSFKECNGLVFIINKQMSKNLGRKFSL